MSRSTSSTGRARDQIVCISGMVTLEDTGLLGALVGSITPPGGRPVRIRQVVGPAGGPVSLRAVNGRLATVCGQFVRERGETILNVTQVIPSRTPVSTVTPLLLLLPLVLLAAAAGTFQVRAEGCPPDVRKEPGR